MNVKHYEKDACDDAEFQALADKLMEQNNQNRMVVNQKKTHQETHMHMNVIVNPNVLVISMMSDKKKLNNNNTNTTNISDEKTGKTIDEDSMKGRFQWEIVGGNPIPYISRAGQKYCAVRMVEMKALNKYLYNLHQDVYNCACIRSFYITESESRLLNEINFKHCDYQFGPEQFTQRDLIVRQSDAIEFYNFIRSCYNKLVNRESDSSRRCGFIRINNKEEVPYTIHNDQKYVPLFYFEDEKENLKQRAKKLVGWDLWYLKFCCKVHGIKNELFADDSISVVSLDDIKNYYPPGTRFEEYWPKNSVSSQRLVISRNWSQRIQWTRQPPNSPQPNQVHGGHSSYGRTEKYPYDPRSATLPVRRSGRPSPAAAGNRY